MLQVQYIKENKEAVIEGLKKRFFNAEEPIEKVLKLDDERKSTQNKLDNSLAEAKKMAGQIGGLYKQGKADEANLLKAKTGELKTESKEFSAKLTEIEEALKTELYNIPNVPHQKVVAGKSEDDNEIIYQEGEIKDLNEDAIPHWEIASKYDIIDFELGTKITGAGFPVYKGKGARYQRALINYFLDKNTDAGYKEFQVPHLVNEASGYGTGQLPDKEGQMYHSTVDDLYLIPTAEVPVTNMYRDTILKAEDFPIKATAYTPCFRREAGSYGAHVRGLNRLHQFDKVELVQLQHPDNSWDALDGMVEHVKGILQELGLPFRVLRLCGGDTGFTAAMTYDFEVWSAAQKRWLEVSSVSNFLDFQANRLKLRFTNKEGKRQLAHTLNGSSLALPRILAALLENNQTEDGVNIPEALRSYTRFDVID
ncbi:MAG: serine--tRNA ligase [Ichthyobacteriaceae bacterium]|nr:serine--tRNA ligase [Ichthyobacteriaceae bacterium]